MSLKLWFTQRTAFWMLPCQEIMIWLVTSQNGLMNQNKIDASLPMLLLGSGFHRIHRKKNIFFSSKFSNTQFETRTCIWIFFSFFPLLFFKSFFLSFGSFVFQWLFFLFLFSCLIFRSCQTSGASKEKEFGRGLQDRDATNRGWLRWAEGAGEAGAAGSPWHGHCLEPLHSVSFCADFTWVLRFQDAICEGENQKQGGRKGRDFAKVNTQAAVP